MLLSFSMTTLLTRLDTSDISLTLSEVLVVEPGTYFLIRVTLDNRVELDYVKIIVKLKTFDIKLKTK